MYLEVMEMGIEIGIVSSSLGTFKSVILQKSRRVGGHSHLTVEEIVVQRD